MALTLGDNFSYQGAKPLDARLKYDTLAAMKAVADATMYDGCMAYCVATDKTYQWKSTNAVDETTGKWREFTSGGGSSVVSGYYKEADHLFYEESTYTTPIAGAANTIYISVDTNKSYRYNSSIFVRIDEEEGQIVQIATLPTASADNLGKIYEYVGATGAYTNGVFYQCVFDGTSTYSWEVCDVVDTLTSDDVTDVKNAFNVSPGQYGGSGIVIDKRGNEYPIGEVIDAQGNKKTLWRKTFVLSNYSDSNMNRHSIEIANYSSLDVDEIFNMYGTIHAKTTGFSGFYPLSAYVTSEGSPNPVYFYLNANHTNKVINITGKNMWWSETYTADFYVVMEYTKTV